MSSTAVAVPSKPEQLAKGEPLLVREETFGPPMSSNDQEAIARLAYCYWEERLKNNVPGSAEEDWYRAEEELGF